MLRAATLASASVTAIQRAVRGFSAAVRSKPPDRGLARRRFLDLESRVRDVAHPPVAILLKAALQQRHHRRRCLPRQRLPVGFGLQDRAEDLDDRVAGKRRPAGQHFVEHAAERPDVGACVRGSRVGLLRRHVRAVPRITPGWWQSPSWVTATCPVRRVGTDRLRQAEVEHLHVPVGRDLDVRGLQIAMDDALAVRRFQRLGNLASDLQRLVHRHRPVGETIAESLALDQLQHETERLIPVLWPVDGISSRP